MLYEQVNHTCEADLIQTNGSRNHHIIHINDKSGPFTKSYLSCVIAYCMLYYFEIFCFTSLLKWVQIILL